MLCVYKVFHCANRFHFVLYPTLDLGPCCDQRFPKIVKKNRRKVFCLASSTLFRTERTKFIQSVHWQRLSEGTKHTIVGEKSTERERFRGTCSNGEKLLKKSWVVSRCGASFLARRSSPASFEKQIVYEAANASVCTVDQEKHEICCCIGQI